MLHPLESRIRGIPRGRRDFSGVASGAEVVRSAVRAIEGCDGAGLFSVAHEAVITTAWTDDAIVELDQLQFERDEGPCLDAVCERVPYWAPDLAVDPRWPNLHARALELGLRSVHAMPLAVPGICALALYGRKPGAFNAVVRARSSRFATDATTALVEAGDDACT